MDKKDFCLMAHNYKLESLSPADWHCPDKP